MNNIYQKGQIYTIRSHQSDMFYIGSTTQALHQRLSGHRRCFKHWSADKENRDFITSYEILKFDDHYIELLEIFACNSKKELNKREGMHIRLQEKCVNKCIAGRTKKEYKIDNKEQIKKNNKQNYDNNKEQILERVKKYNEENKEQILEYGKQYYDEHKQQINEKKRQNQTCECGAKHTSNGKSRHLNTKKHKTYLENNNAII